MAIKIDLEKAYDKLEWNFIREMLIWINIPCSLVDLIMSCVSSVYTSILFNRGCLQPLYQSRGIRQGDPFSLYLFIICMDYLGQLIEEKCSENLWKLVRSSKSGPAFSHLMFVDDLVLNFWNIGRDSDDAEKFTSEMHDPCTRSRYLQERTTQKHLQGAPVWSRPNTLRRLSQKMLLQL